MAFKTLANFLRGVWTDDGRGNDAVRVVVAAENRPPSGIFLSDNTVPSLSPAGTRIGILTVQDPNDSEYHELSILSDPDEKFRIENPRTSETTTTYLTLKDSVNYTELQSHSVTIRATDPTGLTYDRVFTILVTRIYTNLYSAYLDGINQYLQLENPSNFHFSTGSADTPFSFFMWAKPQEISTFIFCAKGPAASRELLFYIDTSNKINLTLYGSTGTTIYLRAQSSNAVSSILNTWVHVGFTYDGSGTKEGLTLYLNGNVLSSAKTSLGTYVTINDSSAPVTIGSWDVVYYSEGYYEEPIFFSRELTAVEVEELYGDGLPYDYSLHSRADDIVSWHRNGDDDNDDFTSLTGRLIDQVGDNDIIPVGTDASSKTTEVPV